MVSVLGDIYLITNKVTGMMYVGQTKYSADRRFKEHVHNALNTKRNLHLYNSMRKYGIENFELTILETCVDESMLDEREMYYIDKYDTFNSGYNYTKGGGGVRGYHHSKETRLKMGASISNAMWKINTPERTAKIIAAQKGRSFTEEHKQHIKESIGDRYGKNNPFYGKHHSSCTKRKISDSKIIYNVCQYENGILLNTFSSVENAAMYCIESGYTCAKLRSVMYRIYYTCIGKQKECYGFNWKYLEKCIDYPESGSNSEDEQPNEVPTNSE